MDSPVALRRTTLIPGSLRNLNPSKPSLSFIVRSTSSRAASSSSKSYSKSFALLGPPKYLARTLWLNGNGNGNRASSSDVPSTADGPAGVREPSWVEFVTSERVKVVAMVGLALALCNADRVVMSVAIVPLSVSRAWRQSFAGVVQVPFSFNLKNITIVSSSIIENNTWGPTQS